MAFFRQAGARDVQLWRRVLIDRLQQLEAALRALRVALKTVGAVAFQTVGGVLNQRAAFFGLREVLAVVQLFLIGADLQYPLLLVCIERFGAAQQLAFA